jgi:16S rRNA (guanine(966)-N(2))-methyltransferase RsmD
MLRITAGDFRGRRLKVPKVEATRPLVERAREGMFNHLGALVADALVWDVYAGSGILGLEALSRGAAKVVAIERHHRAAAQLEENADLLGCRKQLQCLRIDTNRLPALADSQPAPDLIFFDPPYDDFRKGGPGRIKVWGLFLDLAHRLNPGGCAIVHTPRGILNEEELSALPGIERRDYSNTSLYWWHKPAAANTSASDPEPPSAENEPHAS